LSFLIPLGQLDDLARNLLPLSGLGRTKWSGSCNLHVSGA